MVHAGALRPERRLGRARAWAPRSTGLALHGGIVQLRLDVLRVHDFMRPAIRLSALMGLDAVWIFSHDLGWRSARTARRTSRSSTSPRCARRPKAARRRNEASEAWGVTSRRTALFCLFSPARTSQPSPLGRRARVGVAPRAYARVDSDSLDVVLVAHGCRGRHGTRAADSACREDVQVVLMPCWELFEARTADYREVLLGVPKMPRGGRWSRWVDASIGIDTFGASGKLQVLGALRHQPGGGRRRAGARGGPRPLVDEGQRRLHPGRAGRCPRRRRARLPATSTHCARPSLPAGAGSSVWARSRTATPWPGREVALAGERDNVRIDGFDFGRPREFILRLGGRDPRSPRRTARGPCAPPPSAARRVVASLLNLDAVVRRGERRGPRDPLRRRRGRLRDRRRLRRGPDRRALSGTPGHNAHRRRAARRCVRQCRGHRRRVAPRTSARRSSTRTSRGRARRRRSRAPCGRTRCDLGGRGLSSESFVGDSHPDALVTTAANLDGPPAVQVRRSGLRCGCGARRIARSEPMAPTRWSSLSIAYLRERR